VKDEDEFTQEYQGPFTDGNDRALKTFLSNIETFTIDYYLRNIIPEEVPASANCYLWYLSLQTHHIIGTLPRNMILDIAGSCQSS
jgi:hypothetical protein